MRWAARLAALDPSTGFRVAIGLATLVMLGLSRPLWVGTTDFARVPFLPGIPGPTGWLSRSLFVALAAAIALGTAGVAPRATFGLAFVLLAGLVLGDQHRFQPWAYQFGMTALALATASRSDALGLSRLFLVALYVHSGLSKCDLAFAQGMGARFLGAVAGPMGADLRSWPEPARLSAALAMPAWEILVGVGLALRRARRVALVGAIAMHAGLLWVLGPFGLRQSAIVLVWNLALIVEVVLLFGRADSVPAEESGGGTRLAPWAKGAFALAALLPFGERWGFCDSWPGFALYAGHTERTEVQIEGPTDRLPAVLRRHLVPGGGGAEGAAMLDLTGWSREVRGVPVYPQGRACNGLAEDLARRLGDGFRVKVIQWGRAGLWTDRREVGEAIGAEGIRRLGERYRLNAHPARPSA